MHQESICPLHGTKSFYSDIPAKCNEVFPLTPRAAIVQGEINTVPNGASSARNHHPDARLFHFCKTVMNSSLHLILQ